MTVLQDRQGVRWWPIYRLFMAWSVRQGCLRCFGPFCLN